MGGIRVIQAHESTSKGVTNGMRTSFPTNQGRLGLGMLIGLDAKDGDKCRGVNNPQRLCFPHFLGAGWGVFPWVFSL